MKQFWAVLRTSEFWTVAAQAIIETQGLPVPDEFKAAGWVYVVARVVSKLAKYVVKNPANPSGGWMKAD